jgi:hypothetical protein
MSKKHSHSSEGTYLAGMINPMLGWLSDCEHCQRAATMALVAMELARLDEAARAEALAEFIAMLPGQVEIAAAMAESDTAHAAGMRLS